ncbi:MAG: NTP/NDP exchange transporter [Rickettsiales bacterium]|nr:MAG: NTP/NDP exchange transporter [Rickettsiales bacterium]
MISQKLQDIIWPIKRNELKLFVPLSLMMLAMLFNFGSLRSIKDSLVVPNIGAEVISFLKLWLVLPSTVIFTLIYIKLSNKFEYERLFYIIISFFLLFFIFFTYVLFPQQYLLHPSDEMISNLLSNYPNFKWFIKILSKWSYALMYVFCELWSVVIINLLFWQFANHIFDTKSAKRFYPFLGVVGNFGLIIAGNVLVSFSDLSGIIDSNIVNSYTNNIDFQCKMVLRPIMNSIIFSGILIIVLFAYINKYVLKNIVLKKRDDNKTKTSLSLKDSFSLLIKSKYIGHIVLLVLCYGLVINLLEGPWKSKVRQLYPNTIDYINFMGQFNIWMGTSCVIFTFVGSNILRKFSWKISALITPYMITITGIIFFAFVIFTDQIDFNLLNPIYFAVIIGAVQNILSKSTKYSLFDSTKEMAYIPLPLELKTKGKAAVEVIGLKFGKSLGAFIQSFIFIIMPMATFDSIAIYLSVIFIIIVAVWIWNVVILNEAYVKLKGNDDEAN